VVEKVILLRLLINLLRMRLLVLLLLIPINMKHPLLLHILPLLLGENLLRKAVLDLRVDGVDEGLGLLDVVVLDGRLVLVFELHLEKSLLDGLRDLDGLLLLGLVDGDRVFEEVAVLVDAEDLALEFGGAVAEGGQALFVAGVVLFD
jgi:hypothetical protein